MKSTIFSRNLISNFLRLFRGVGATKVGSHDKDDLVIFPFRIVKSMQQNEHIHAPHAIFHIVETYWKWLKNNLEGVSNSMMHWHSLDSLVQMLNFFNIYNFLKILFRWYYCSLICTVTQTIDQQNNWFSIVIYLRSIELVNKAWQIAHTKFVNIAVSKKSINFPFKKKKSINFMVCHKCHFTILYLQKTNVILRFWRAHTVNECEKNLKKSFKSTRWDANRRN